MGQQVKKKKKKKNRLSRPDWTRNTQKKGNKNGCCVCGHMHTLWVESPTLIPSLLASTGGFLVLMLHDAVMSDATMLLRVGALY